MKQTTKHLPRPNRLPTVPGLILSFRYAGQGIWYAIRTQRNFRIHLAISLLIILLGVFFNLRWTEWAILAITIALVLATELLNTSIEAAIDVAHPDYHPLAKIAKDAAAGAVLLMAIGAVCVGAALFLPRILALLR